MIHHHVALASHQKNQGRKKEERIVAKIMGGTEEIVAKIVLLIQNFNFPPLRPIEK
jgi:hypothetical protein